MFKPNSTGQDSPWTHLGPVVSDQDRRVTTRVAAVQSRVWADDRNQYMRLDVTYYTIDLVALSASDLSFYSFTQGEPF